MEQHLPHGSYGLFLALILGFGVWRSVWSSRGSRNRWARGLFLLGSVLIYSVTVKEIIVGLGGPERPNDVLAGVVGLACWGVAAVMTAERKRAVRERLKVAELEIDPAGLDDNPMWVKDQLSATLKPDDWKGLLPLVDAGWNGGFAWLTPESVRAELARSPKALELPPS